MIPVRNIPKMLIAVLFTAGMGLLLMGARGGRSFSFTGAPDGDGWVQVSKKKVTGNAGLPQIHNEGAAVRAHKSPLKRHRSRFGLDAVYAAFTIDHPHSGNISLPEIYRPGVHVTILAGSSLRGPPCV